MTGDPGTVRLRARGTTHTVCLDGEALIWDDGAQALHRLNRSASRIWLALSEWQTVDALTLGVAPGARSERVAADMIRCVEQLEESGLVERRADYS